MSDVMQGIAAVVTTGIYCRPGCPAHPLPQNVQTFPVAAAAGYRACLRCRPYRLPMFVGPPQRELVCRAVQLILDGALDHGTEARLAERLGVSARHLRRLFMTHLGVTPDGLARSARAHFARRLLDETDLPITEVAFAAGFGSLRQFNRVCQAIFRASPSDLRAKRRRADRLVADGGLAFRLAFHGTLDWTAMATRLARTAIPGVEHVAGDVYRRTVVIAGDPGVLELSPGGDDHLVLRAHLPHWNQLLNLVRRARRIASLDADLDEPLRQLGDDAVIGPLTRARPGVRAPGAWDPFEAGVRAIVGHDAPAITGSLVERYGTPVGGLRELGLTHTFPRPEVLAHADLTGIGCAPATAAAVRAFAAATADGTIHLERGASLDQLVAPIEALPGVGRWVAHYVALHLGEPDAFPLSDHQLADWLASRRRHASPAERADLAGRWRPWRALAVTHLWLAGCSSEPVAASSALRIS